MSTATLERLEKPTLYFDMLRAYGMGMKPIAQQVRRFFGHDNYNEFAVVGRQGKEIPAESRLRVDRFVWDTVGELFEVPESERARFWKKSIRRTNDPINFARGILFPDQERRATLTVETEWTDGRPSSMLEILTMPSSLIGERCRAEHYRQLALALPCAEEIKEEATLIGPEDIDEVDAANRVLNGINDFLRKEGFFLSKKGHTDDYHYYSYHTPFTNEVVGVSTQYPDPRFKRDLWVKSHPDETRTVGIRDANGELAQMVRVLYDQRGEKEAGARAIKGLHRSKKAAEKATEPELQRGKVEILPHIEDRVGFKLVVIGGGHPLRDRVMAELGDKLRKLFGDENVIKDDAVSSDNGKPDRFPCKRIKIKTGELNKPIEAIVQSLEDYLTTTYKVGEYDSKKGMHDGPAHILYKLDQVAYVAPELWPFPICGLNINEAKKLSSFEYAGRLGRMKSHTSPYLDLVLPNGNLR